MRLNNSYFILITTTLLQGTLLAEKAEKAGNAPEIAKNMPPPPARGSCSKDGDMFCNGQGFDTCDHGQLVYRACAPGTTCRQIKSTTILCDYPQRIVPPRPDPYDNPPRPDPYDNPPRPDPYGPPPRPDPYGPPRPDPYGPPPRPDPYGPPRPDPYGPPPRPDPYGPPPRPDPYGPPRPDPYGPPPRPDPYNPPPPPNY